MNQISWITVKVANGKLEADIYAAHLQSHGVPVRVIQESAGATYGLTVGSLGEAYVQVPSSSLLFEEE